MVGGSQERRCNLVQILVHDTAITSWASDSCPFDGLGCIAISLTAPHFPLGFALRDLSCSYARAEHCGLRYGYQLRYDKPPRYQLRLAGCQDSGGLLSLSPSMPPAVTHRLGPFYILLQRNFVERYQKSAAKTLVVFCPYPVDYLYANLEILVLLPNNSKHGIVYFGGHRQWLRRLVSRAS